jgi:hypothetical protein
VVTKPPNDSELPDDFKARVDELVAEFPTFLGKRPFRLWLAIEYLFDVLAEVTEAPELLQEMRRRYHRRLLAAGTNPLTIAATFDYAMAVVVHHHPPRKRRDLRRKSPCSDS